jgi:hypothetical protein
VLWKRQALKGFKGSNNCPLVPIKSIVGISVSVGKCPAPVPRRMREPFLAFAGASRTGRNGLFSARLPHLELLRSDQRV